MVNNTNLISGKAMAVLIGFGTAIGIWFIQLGFWNKFVISALGVGLILLGARND